MTLEDLVTEMVETAANYPGIDYILYREVLETAVLIVSTFVGIAAVILSIGLPIILAIELMFLNFPPMTAFLTDREDYHAEAGVEKKHRHWGLFVNDARKALRMHAEDGKNVNLCYLQVKWLTFMSVGTTITLLFSGHDAIVRFIMRMISPILVRLAA